MISIHDIKIDAEATLGSKKLLVGIAPWHEYKDGARTGKQLGYTYTVALPDHELEKIAIKIPGDLQTEKPDGYAEVELTGVELKPYYAKDKTVMFAASATGIKLVKAKQT